MNFASLPFNLGKIAIMLSKLVKLGSSAHQICKKFSRLLIILAKFKMKNLSFYFQNFPNIGKK